MQSDDELIELLNWNPHHDPFIPGNKWHNRDYCVKLLRYTLGDDKTEDGSVWALDKDGLNRKIEGCVTIEGVAYRVSAFTEMNAKTLRIRENPGRKDVGNNVGKAPNGKAILVTNQGGGKLFAYFVNARDVLFYAKGSGVKVGDVQKIAFRTVVFKDGVVIRDGRKP